MIDTLRLLNNLLQITEVKFTDAMFLILVVILRDGYINYLYHKFNGLIFYVILLTLFIILTL